MNRSQKSAAQESGIAVGQLIAKSIFTPMRMLGWLATIFLFAAPLNWLHMWLTNEKIPGGYGLDTIAIGVVCWLIGGFFAWLIVRSARKKIIVQNKNATETAMRLQQLADAPLTSISPSSAMIRSDETAYAAIPASLKKMQSVGFTASTSGASFRVAKGITIRSSGTRGHVVKDLVKVADGELVVTDKRIIFAGDMQSFEIKLEKLLNVTTYNDGFAFHEGKTTHMLQTNNQQDRSAFEITLQKVLQKRTDH